MFVSLISELGCSWIQDPVSFLPSRRKVGAPSIARGSKPGCPVGSVPAHGQELELDDFQGPLQPKMFYNCEDWRFTIIPRTTNICIGRCHSNQVNGGVAKASFQEELTAGCCTNASVISLKLQTWLLRQNHLYEHNRYLPPWILDYAHSCRSYSLN